MSSKDIITVIMLRRANEEVMSKGVSRAQSRTVYSKFLRKTIENTVASDAKTINSAWKKVREQFMEP